ncbi:hypothetical protein [Brevundimonas sp. TWP3-1-2b1]|uniref:hypothetical protein n=1 Tax=Brevundimonas sp. TWP3-1-2b1 TaxID=2804650 RepID=UPI003CF90537
MSTSHAFTILGYQTPAQAKAWFAGKRGLFDDVEAWLQETMPDRFRADRESFPGIFQVEVDDEVDAVLIKLAWGDHLAAEGDPPWIV